MRDSNQKKNSVIANVQDVKKGTASVFLMEDPATAAGAQVVTIQPSM
jgi:hypothetical protein